MATNPNDLPFELDQSGITYKLREIGKRVCQDIRSETQHAAVKQTLKVLFKYADECYADRAEEVQRELKKRAERDAERAKYQHSLSTVHEGDKSSEVKPEVKVAEADKTDKTEVKEKK